MSILSIAQPQADPVTDQKFRRPNDPWHGDLVQFLGSIPGEVIGQLIALHQSEVEKDARARKRQGYYPNESWIGGWHLGMAAVLRGESRRRDAAAADR